MDSAPEELKPGRRRGSSHRDPDDLSLETFARVSVMLKQAHRMLARSGTDLPTRAALTRRLLVITNAAKHDVVNASRRLEAFLGGLTRDISAVLRRDSDSAEDARRGPAEPSTESPRGEPSRSTGATDGPAG